MKINMIFKFWNKINNHIDVLFNCSIYLVNDCYGDDFSVLIVITDLVDVVGVIPGMDLFTPYLDWCSDVCSC